MGKRAMPAKICARSKISAQQVDICERSSENHGDCTSSREPREHRTLQCVRSEGVSQGIHALTLAQDDPKVQNVRVSGGFCRILTRGRIRMSRFALWVQLEAKPGREKEVADFLKAAQSLVEQETQTVSWYAV